MQRSFIAAGMLTALLTVGAGCARVTDMDANIGNGNGNENDNINVVGLSNEPDTGDDVMTANGNINGPVVRVSCGLTEITDQGEHFISDAPVLLNGDNNPGDLPGDALRMYGTVFAGAQGEVPVANARIDIWQADSNGVYHPNASGAAASFKPEEIALRGHVLADEAGKFEIHTILPGEYGTRARHLHLRASAPGYRTVTTEIFVSQPGDKVMAQDDVIGKTVTRCSMPEIKDNFGVKQMLFDLRLAPI